MESHRTIMRYREDAEFAALVDAIYRGAMQFKFTASELRDAAYCAAVKVEAETARSLIEAGILVPPPTRRSDP